MVATIHSSEPSGSIIAFEGHPETISTQLRLLPSSPEILVLPGIHCYLSEDELSSNFRADAFIRKAHEAVVARNEAARAFLHVPAHTSGRLVFMSGGTPSAQALCIREIMKHDTDGDDEEAEAQFDFLIREGLAGLASQAMKWEDSQRFKLTTLKTGNEGFDARRDAKRALRASQRSNLEQIDEDPITRAMRAAEALDRQTGHLQPSTELDLTLSSRRRSVNLPMYGYSDNYGDAAPFYLFGGSSHRGLSSDPSVRDSLEHGVSLGASVPSKFAVTHYDDSPEKPTGSPSLEAHQPPGGAGETYGSTFLHSPRLAPSVSKSDTSDLRHSAFVVFGEASLVDMRMPSEKGPISRVRSLDGIYPSAKTEDPDRRLSTRPRSWDSRSGQEPVKSRSNSVNRARTIVVRAKNLPNVNLAPVPSGKKRKPINATYVDRGTDADLMENMTEDFTPVFPVTEDLVLYFKEEVSDVILDQTIRRFKDGTYPILYQSTDSSETDTVNDSLPKTPNTSSTCDGDVTPRARGSEDDASVPYSPDDDHGTFGNVHLSWPPTKPASIKTVEIPRARKIEAPPTPEKTPTPSESGKDHKVHEFGISSSQTPVAIQNSLRTILNIYFPPGVNGYRQFQFSFLPELEGLWTPIFREAEPGSPRTNNHRMDQILAIGSQQGVEREYSSKIVGLLSKLGVKESGMNRSGRLDFRYDLRSPLFLARKCNFL